MELKSSIGRKKIIGIVIKDKMDKSVVIEVEKFLKHPRYHKYLKMKKKYKAHDEANVCKVGDKVLLVETRPLSKDKRWLVKEVIKREAPVAIVKDEVVKDDTGAN
ncbi:MAG: 30S ribosomal protein S17 [Syntrophobacterales bacterium]|jgi:small subunit ribosomal protein S17|nr:30S ribosomal protein S17 [Syntrophobacterales bacterium]